MAFVRVKRVSEPFEWNKRWKTYSTLVYAGPIDHARCLTFGVQTFVFNF